ncbi:MAG: 16S rRNA (uracil(1498)-N(3))-methyltransferase [Flavobacteriales bacterium]|nr:16S rRNA (uracil(1498)-N(3))-methyltransferase [Flavobacteriales bacterium]|tara:strand:- start:619 stop:1320 length:702 start_codon:yes stop_codon:yes gene_type:complete
MQFFYTPDISDNTYTFSKEESRHCIKVLRKKVGDGIHLVDGKGNLYHTTLIDDDPKGCTVEVKQKEVDFNKRNYRIHMVVSPTKNNDRFEWFLEKVTELGVDEITPIICQNSERKVIKAERLNKILVAAMKQSLKAYLPQLNEAVSWKDFIEKKFNTERFIAHCGEGSKTPLKQWLKPQQDVMILIGPEGDFSDTEVIEAMSSGFVPVSLGKSRLRTETAAVAACHTINLTNE